MNFGRPASTSIDYVDRAPPTDGEPLPSQQLTVPDWPTKPQRLHTVGQAEVWSLIGDIAMFLASLAFGALGVLAWFLHDKPIEGNRLGLQVEKASRLGPTVFPLLFAALVGRSLKVFGRVWARNGAKLGTIEAVMSSQSVWSTLEFQLRLRKASPTGALLLTLWCLSPLGGQASLRVLQRGWLTSRSSVPVQYRSTGPAATVFAAAAAESHSVVVQSVLAAPPRVMAQHEDRFGNVKIPRLDALAAGPPMPGGWKAVPPLLAPDDFSAMLGLRVVGLPLDREAHFHLESSYLSATCGAFVQQPYSVNVTGAELGRLSDVMKFDFAATAAAGLMPGTAEVDGQFPTRRTYVVDTDRRPTPGRWEAYAAAGAPPAAGKASGDATPRRLVFGSIHFPKRGGTPVINLANCSVHETHVESAVVCPDKRVGGGDCRVHKMRLSLSDRRPAQLTLFDNAKLAQQISQRLPQSSASRIDISSPPEFFLNASAPTGFDTGAELVDSPSYSVDLSKSAPQMFSRRFSLLLNTFFQALVSGNEDALNANYALFGNASTTTPADDMRLFTPERPPPPRPSAQHPADTVAASPAAAVPAYAAAEAAITAALRAGLPYVPAHATAHAMARTAVFACHGAWLGVLLLATAAPAATGAAALWQQLRGTLAPDALRCVAGLATRANRRFGVRLPPGGSALDGMARSRLLRDVRVRVGDVRGDSDVGEVAFVAADYVAARQLERQRLYA